VDLQNLDLQKPDRERIRQLNREYISLAIRLSRSCMAASLLLGIEQPVVEALRTVAYSSLQTVVDSDCLVAQLRFTDEQTWRRLADGTLDANHMLHAFLKTLPRAPTP